MPVLVEPGTPGLFGPGMLVRLFSDNQNVLTPNAFWRVHLFLDDALTQAIGFGEKKAQGHTETFTWLTDRTASWGIQGFQTPVHGETVFVQGELSDPGNVEDTGQATVAWNDTAGLGVQLLERTLTAGGGLTPDEAAQLQRIETNQQTTTPIPGPLNALIQTSPLNEWLATFAPFDLAGRGTRPPPLFLGLSLAIGLWIRGVSAPPFLSLRDGFLTTYRERIAQLVLLNTSLSSGRQIPLEVYELRIAEAIWLFPQRHFDVMGFDVLPGCTVNCQWITVATP